MYDYLDMMDSESMVCYRHLVTGLGTPSPWLPTHARTHAHLLLARIVSFLAPCDSRG